MREGIGSVVLYNIIIIFIVITFGFLSATLSYMKAFKVNGRIANALEKFEGYNTLSAKEIRDTLDTIGYRQEQIDCEPLEHNGVTYYPVNDNRVDSLKIHEYCLYEYANNDNGDFEGNYFSYGIVTYIHIDIPVLGGFFRLPVISESESIYKFSPDEMRGSQGGY